MADPTRDEYDRLRLGFDALAAIVREEFPADHSLAQIAETWPPTFDKGITVEHVAALRELEAGE